MCERWGVRDEGSLYQSLENGQEKNLSEEPENR